MACAVLPDACCLLLGRAVRLTHKEGRNARFLPLHIVKCILWAKWDINLGRFWSNFGEILEMSDLWVVFGSGEGGRRTMGKGQGVRSKRRHEAGAETRDLFGFPLILGSFRSRY